MTTKTGGNWSIGWHAGTLLILALAVLWVHPRKVGAAPVQAMAAYEFVNSVGVNTHFSWATVNYRTRFAEVKAALAELGIRHIREQIGNAQAMPFFKDLNATLGVKLTGLVYARRGSGADERPDAQGLLDTLVRARTLLGPQALAAIEGTNEYNLVERNYGYPAWPQDLHDEQQRLHLAVKQDPALGALAVLAPTLAGPNAGMYYAKLDDMSRVIDFGTAHIYPNRRSFAQVVPEGIAEVRAVSPTQAIWVTETGWHNATGSGALFVDEDVQAKYVARAMVEFSTNPELDKGFIYQLADPYVDPMRQSTVSQFGLLDNDLSPKPKFYAMRNMMHLLCDNRLPGAPGTLDIELAGSLANVRHALYQKASGVFYMLIWLEKQGMGANGLPIVNPPQPVSVGFGEATEAVRTYLPSDPTRDLTLGRRPIATSYRPSRVNLMVEDHIIILEIAPRGVPLPAASTACAFDAS